MNHQNLDYSIREHATTREHARKSAHIPNGLCYGPVVSRRFGSSLGVSFSPPGVWACHWRCPYCQQGQQPLDPAAHAPAADILRAVRHGLHTHATTTDVICVAGGGEPSDHPDFATLSIELGQLARQFGKSLILLTNGDGCTTAENLRSLENYTKIYAKWDPGVSAGAWQESPPTWSAHPEATRVAARLAAVQAIPQVCIQAMLFWTQHGTGNGSLPARAAWLEAMRQLQPREIHLTTVDRDPRLPAVQAVPEAELLRWQWAVAQVTTAACRIFPTSSHPASGKQSP